MGGSVKEGVSGGRVPSRFNLLCCLAAFDGWFQLIYFFLLSARSMFAETLSGQETLPNSCLTIKFNVLL